MTAFSVLRNKDFEKVRELATLFASTATKGDRATLRRRMTDEVLEPLVEGIKAAAAASDRQSRRASETVTVLGGRAVPALSAGGGSGLPGHLFWGSEMGGRKRPPVRIARISKKNPPFVRRHVTMQFREHRPSGYWFFPTLREGLPAVRIGVERIVDDLMIAPIVGVKLKRR